MSRQKIDGFNDIRLGTIKNDNIANDAAIAESKLALNYGTAYLKDNAVLVNENRVIQDGVYITFPASGFKMIDAIDGKTYLLTINNGVLKAEQIE